MEMLKTLNNGLPLINLELSDATKDTLCAFGRGVIRQNEVMNLTAITEPDRVAKLHLLDSLTVLTLADLKNKKVIDVGCGAGFPGVPLKIACPEMKLTLLDSLGKRMNWNILLELTAPYVKVGGAVLAMKGTAAKEEMDEAKNAIRKLGLKVETVKEFPIEDTAHTVIVLRKIAPTPAQYPRRYAKIKQAPL